MINQERLVDTFLELVKIDSPSGGEAQMAEHVAAKLRVLGLQPKVDAMFNIVVKLDGKGKPFLFNAHLDRVEPGRGVKPVVEYGRILSDGTTVLGADDLAGVAAILEAVQSLVEDRAAHVPLEIVLTTQEEIGLNGAKGLDLTQLKAKEGVVLDTHGPVGEIVLVSPTLNSINATIIGQAAHSGVEPEKGVDALRVAAEAIGKMKLGRVDKETTANIGLISGGAARNIVPEKVELMGEARSRSPKKLERQTKAMKQVLEKSARAHGARVEIHIEREFNWYKFRKGDELIKRIAAALKKSGLTPRYGSSGGGSDANVFNAKHMKTVVISVGVEGMHTTNECLPVAELVKAAELLVALATP